MGKVAPLVLAVFAITLASLFLGWITFALANKARASYRAFKDGRKKGG